MSGCSYTLPQFAPSVLVKFVKNQLATKFLCLWRNSASMLPQFVGCNNHIAGSPENLENFRDSNFQIFD